MPGDIFVTVHRSDVPDPSKSDMRLIRALAACAPLLCMTNVSLLAAQTTDSAILGSVSDSLGAPIAGASISARNTATGDTWTLTTSASGRFAFVQLPLGGPYVVTARQIGYLPEARSGYELTLARRVVVQFILKRAPAELAPVVV